MWGERLCNNSFPVGSLERQGGRGKGEGERDGGWGERVRKGFTLANTFIDSM